MKVDYISSHTKVDAMPYIHKEVAFIGRSNVGKSSLINALVGRDVCFVSKKPGKTITINVFSDPYRNIGIIDLPGYGFAKVNATLREAWSRFVPEYLSGRENLRMVFVLVDVRRGICDADIDAVGVVRFSGRPMSLVFTKIDKLSPAELAVAGQKAGLSLQEQGFSCPVYWVSSKQKRVGDFASLKKDTEFFLT